MESRKKLNNNSDFSDARINFTYFFQAKVDFRRSQVAGTERQVPPLMISENLTIFGDFT